MTESKFFNELMESVKQVNGSSKSKVIHTDYNEWFRSICMRMDWTTDEARARIKIVSPTDIVCELDDGTAVARWNGKTGEIYK